MFSARRLSSTLSKGDDRSTDGDGAGNAESARTLSRSGSVSAGNDATESVTLDRTNSSSSSTEVPTWKRELAKRQSALLRRNSNTGTVITDVAPPEKVQEDPIRRPSASSVPASNGGAPMGAEDMPLPEGWKLHKPSDGGRYVSVTFLGHRCCWEFFRLF